MTSSLTMVQFFIPISLDGLIKSRFWELIGTSKNKYTNSSSISFFILFVGLFFEYDLFRFIVFWKVAVFPKIYKNNNTSTQRNKKPI